MQVVVFLATYRRRRAVLKLWPSQLKPRPPLEGQHFHVIVIGGGINGVAIARECARAGKRTLLVEQSDLASGVTSRSTRIIHGGLRYLEHGELSRRGSRSASANVYCGTVTPRTPCPVSISAERAEPAQRDEGSCRPLDVSEVAEGALYPSEIELKRVQRALDAGHRWLLLNYEDAQCEFPERLVAEWVTEAAEAGAVIRNHCEVLRP